jgi:bifunctional non-homologous end joining protein LigD
MVFKTDSQRKAFFANLNRFSVANQSILDGTERAGISMLVKAVERDAAVKLDKDKSWVACDKYDGIRVVAVGNGGLDIFNPRKGGENLAEKFPDVVPDVVEAFGGHEPFIVEGEIISSVHDKNDFHSVVSRINLDDVQQLKHQIVEHPAMFRVFDVMEMDGQDTKSLPLYKRREILEKIIGDGSDNLKLEDCVYNNKLDYADKYIAAGGEGVVFKNLGSTYKPGKKSGDWLKYKKPEGGTFVVYGFERGKGSNSNGVASLLIGVFEDGQFISKGKVGSGLSISERKYLYDKYNPHGLSAVTMPESEWFGVDLKYMEEDVKGSLRQPRIERLREDLGLDALMGET